MGEVKRYGPAGYTIALSEQAGGSLVNYSDYADLEAERDALRAEVAKLSADAAQMREALRILDGFVEPRPSAAEWTGICEMARKLKAALATAAGRNWIDATGAVEGYVVERSYGQYADVQVPDDWAGATVKIVRVKP